MGQLFAEIVFEFYFSSFFAICQYFSISSTLISDTSGTTPERQRLALKGETKKQTPGSNAFVPSAAGMIIAAEVVKDLTQFHVTDLFKESKN